MLGDEPEPLTEIKTEAVWYCYVCEVARTVYPLDLSPYECVCNTMYVAIGWFESNPYRKED